jgi:hypothetical protein
MERLLLTILLQGAHQKTPPVRTRSHSGAAIASGILPVESNSSLKLSRWSLRVKCRQRIRHVRARQGKDALVHLKSATLSAIHTCSDSQATPGVELHADPMTVTKPFDDFYANQQNIPPG